MGFETGPYIQVAAFCENVIEDKAGVLSLIRVIDTLNHTVAQPDPPQEMPPIPWRMKLVIMLKAGLAKGRHEIKIIPEKPSGETLPAMIITAHLEGEERGQNLISDMVMTFDLEGLYWFNAYFDDVLLTKIPFRVKYTRIITGAGKPKPSA